MAKYMFMASYTTHGTKGLKKDGGTGRKEQIDKMIRGLGGTLDSLYYAFGDHDVFGIVDLPDHETATAVSLTVNATGAVQVKTVVLLTPEQVDEAARKSVSYRPPGE